MGAVTIVYSSVVQTAPAGDRGAVHDVAVPVVELDRPMEPDGVIERGPDKA